MTGTASHGLDPSPEISAADNPVGAQPPAQQPGTPPAPGATPPTLPIGGADGGLGVYKPSGIPDHLLGQDDKGTIDKLFTAYSGARGELAKGQPAIPAAKDYQFNWSENVSKLGIAPDDQALGAFRDIAHKLQLTQEQAAIVPQFMDVALEKGWIEKPFDAAGMLASLAPADYRGSPEEKQARGAERLTQAENWIRQLDPKQGFNDDMKQEMRLLTTSLAGVKVLESLMNGGVTHSASPGGGQQPASIGKADLDRRVADPRNDSMHAKFDPAYAEETRQLFKQIYKD